MWKRGGAGEVFYQDKWCQTDFTISGAALKQLLYRTTHLSLPWLWFCSLWPTRLVTPSNSQTHLTHLHSDSSTPVHTNTHVHTQDSGIPISNQCSPVKQTQQTCERRNGEGGVCLYWTNIESGSHKTHARSRSFVHWRLKVKPSDVSVNASNLSLPAAAGESHQPAPTGYRLCTVISL